MTGLTGLLGRISAFGISGFPLLETADKITAAIRDKYEG